MSRKKLPAYGAALMARRRRGDHPLCVHLIYGFRWRDPTEGCMWQRVLAGEHPLLAVKPLDYMPGTLEWSLLAGLRVAVFDQEGAAAWYEDPNLGPARPQFLYFYELVRELAEFAAEVTVHSPAFVPRGEDAHVLAFCRRGWQRDATNNHGWPHWWSAEIEEKNAERRAKWFDALHEHTTGERIAACA